MVGKILLAVSWILIVAGGFVWCTVAKANFRLSVMTVVVMLMMITMKMKQS